MRRALWLCLLLPAACSSSAGSASGGSASGGSGAGPASDVPLSSAGFTQSAGPSKGAVNFSASAPRTSVPVAGPRGCTNSQLRITGALDAGGAAAGHQRAILVFTNITAATTCTLYGYPGVDGTPPSPGSGQVQHFRRTLSGAEGGPGKRSTILLVPGASASAVVEASSVPSGGTSGCEPFQNLMVTAPNTTRTVTVPVDSLPSCDPQVHPVVAGATG